MIILLTIICVICFVIEVVNEDNDNAALVFAALGILVCGILDLLAIVACVDSYKNGWTAKDKIKMYEEENVKIEEQIDTLVKQYMKYEGDTLKEFKSDSSITLVTMYPELKSDALVTAQINTYIANNNKIKELKEAAINLKIGKWLLYFGG